MICCNRAASCFILTVHLDLTARSTTSYAYSCHLLLRLLCTDHKGTGAQVVVYLPTIVRLEAPEVIKLSAVQKSAVIREAAGFTSLLHIIYRIYINECRFALCVVEQYYESWMSM